MAVEARPLLMCGDEEPEVFLTRQAFARAGVLNPTLALSAHEVTLYLSGVGQYRNRTRFPEPILLVLDWAAESRVGPDVLRWLHDQPSWRDTLPVIVLSSSEHPEDRRRAIELGAHEYLLKPSQFTALMELALEINRLWLEPAQEESAAAMARRERR